MYQCDWSSDVCSSDLVVGGKVVAQKTLPIRWSYDERIDDGLVVVKTEHGGPTQRVRIAEASHPTPDAAGVAAGQEILDLARKASEDDLVLALISGGGSALLVSPAAGLGLPDLQGLTAHLLACGATINEINCLRKHCSGVKGGQLARTVAPATLITFVLSDVIGSPLDVIASGPTVSDSSTWADAWALAEKYDLVGKLPGAITARLQAGLRGDIPDTPGADDPIFTASQTVVVADNFLAAQAAQRKATELGYNTLLLTTFLDGDAAGAGRLLAALAKEVQISGHPVPAPACLILGGETTVQLGSNPGQGGRNQELALAAGLALQGSQGVTVVSLATDGSDGPTDSAGAMADGFISVGGASTPEIRTKAMEEFIDRYTKMFGEYNDESNTKVYALDYIIETLKANPSAINDVEVFKAAMEIGRAHV